MPRSHSVGSMLPLAKRLSWLGGGTAVLVLLALSAIVQQSLTGRGHDRARTDRPAVAESRPTRRPTRSTRRPARTAPLERAVRTAVLKERAGIARKAFGVHRLPEPVVSPARVDRSAGWAFGGAVIPPPADSSAVPDPSLFAARRTEGGWRVALAGSADFERLLRVAPTKIVPKDERSLLLRYDGATVPQQGVATGLTLPWNTGQSWTLRSIAGEGGLQFGGGDGRVRAPGAGRLYRLCAAGPGRGMLLLVHASGLASVYYQVTGVPDLRPGATVRQGAYLGRTGTDRPCGGGRAAGTDAVSFSLLCADDPVSMDGAQIGGWTLHSAAGRVWAERANLRIDAGNPLLNFGTTGGRSASASPDLRPSVKPPRLPFAGPSGHLLSGGDL